MGGSVDGATPVETKLLTLRYSPELGGIDDAPLRALGREYEIVSLREHFFIAQDLPHLLCIVTCRRRAAAQTARAAPTTPTATEASKRSSADPPPDLTDEQRRLYDAVRTWRADQAERAGVPRYVVLTNRDVEALVRRRPTSLGGLRKIPGIGEAKVTQYGEALLALLRPADAPRLVTKHDEATQP